MDPARFARLSELFESARRLEPTARRAFLEELRRAEPDLCAEVVSLLAEHDSGTRERLDVGVEPPGDGAVEAASPSLENDRISDDYELLERIGEGGFGSVHRAQQIRPIRREVAVKVIKPGMDSREVLARFEAERQTLALLDHPHVAKIYDAGHSALGRPYFVMEFVRGIPLTKYCDARRLTVGERIELMIRVCAAVQHAHQKAIVHRDLKPANVLVTEIDGRPTPKVIDFGISKALDERITERTLATSAGHLVGTPEYMAPEQADPHVAGVDTRADVYSLGVILYELVSGGLPLDLERPSSEVDLVAVLRRIRDEEPPRASTRAAESTGVDSENDTAHKRRVTGQELVRELRGDLDWVTAKALEKDRERRYQSPSELAEDLRRYLGGFEVAARPPSTSYRLRKFVRRNRIAVAFASVVVALLLVGILGTGWGLLRARNAAALAEENAYLGIIAYSDAALNRGAPDDARELLGQGTAWPDRFEWGALHARAEIRIPPCPLPPLDGSYVAATFSADGTHLVRVAKRDRSGQDLHHIEVFSVAPDGSSVRREREFTVPRPVATVLYLSDDGRWLWNRGGSEVYDCFLGESAFSAAEGRTVVAFDPRAARVFTAGPSSGGGGRTVRALSLVNGATAWERPFPNAFLAVLSPDGSLLAANDEPDQNKREPLHLIDTAHGEIVHTIEGLHLPSGNVTFSRDGRALIANDALSLVVWRIERTEEGLEVAAHIMGASPLGQAVAGPFFLTDRDGELLFAPAGTGLEARFEILHLPSRNRIGEVALQTLPNSVPGLSTDGLHYLIYTPGRGIVRQHWPSQLDVTHDLARDFEQPPPNVERNPGRSPYWLPITALATHPHADEIAVGLGNAGPFSSLEARVYDLDTNERVTSLWPMNRLAASAALAWSPDGNDLASFSLHGFRPVIPPTSAPFRPYNHSGVSVYDSSTGKLRFLSIVPFSDSVLRREPDPQFMLWMPPGLSYHPEGNRIYVWGGSATAYPDVLCLDAASGEPRPRLEGHANAVHDLAFLPGGDLVTVSRDHTIRFWDAAEHREITERRIAFSEDVRYETLAVHPDGRHLAVGCWGASRIDVYDLTSGKRVHSLGSHPMFTLDLDFSPDGSRLVTAGADGTVKLWRTESPEVEDWFQLVAYGSPSGSNATWAARFSHDGRRIVSIDLQGHVEVIEARPWAERERRRRAAPSHEARQRYDLEAERQRKTAETPLARIAAALHLRELEDPTSWPASLASATLPDGSSLSPVQRDLVRASVLVQQAERGEQDDPLLHLNNVVWDLCRFESRFTPGYQRALDLLAPRITEDLDRPDILNTWGTLLLRLGRAEAAIAPLQRAAELHRQGQRRNQNPSFLLLLATAQAHAGRREDARASLERAQRQVRGPFRNDPEVRTFLAEAQAAVAKD